MPHLDKLKQKAFSFRWKPKSGFAIKLSKPRAIQFNQETLRSLSSFFLRSLQLNTDSIVYCKVIHVRLLLYNPPLPSANFSKNCENGLFLGTFIQTQGKPVLRRHSWNPHKCGTGKTSDPSTFETFTWKRVFNLTKCRYKSLEQKTSILNIKLKLPLVSSLIEFNESSPRYRPTSQYYILPKKRPDNQELLIYKIIYRPKNALVKQYLRPKH